MRWAQICSHFPLSLQVCLKQEQVFCSALNGIFAYWGLGQLIRVSRLSNIEIINAQSEVLFFCCSRKIKVYPESEMEEAA